MTNRRASFLFATFAVFGAACTKAAEPASDAAIPALAMCAETTHAGADGGCEADELADAEVGAAVEETEALEPLPTLPGKCPNAANVEGLYAMDWSKQFPLSDDVAAHAKGIAGLAAETKAWSAELELELRTACTKLAAELGAKGPFASATLACGAASSELVATKAKLGGAKITVKKVAPLCMTSLEAFASCLGKCVGALDAAAPESSCQGQPIGKCSGICEGACEPQAGKCSGTCTGHCDSGFHGSCKGSCKGSCDGKDLKGTSTCAGTCDGTCDGAGSGECKGTCLGGCTTHAQVCSGTCRGKCSVDLKDAKCTGLFKSSGTPEVCRSYCETRVDRRATCTPGALEVRVTGAKDAAVAKLYESALRHHLGAIEKIGQGLAVRLQAASNNAKVVTAGVKAVTTASDSEELRAVTPCLSGFVGPATEGSLGLKSSMAAATAVLAAAK